MTLTQPSKLDTLCRNCRAWCVDVKAHDGKHPCCNVDSPTFDRFWPGDFGCVHFEGRA